MQSAQNSHSPIGASSAYRWFECPGSVKLSEKAPPEVPSEYANEGTVAHDIASAALLKKKPDHKLHPEIERTDEMQEAVDVYLHAIKKYMWKGKYLQFVEQQGALDCVHANLRGTLDCALVESNMKSIIAIDYKHGAGVPVNVKSNKQLMYYLLIMLWHLYKEKKWGADPRIFGWGHQFNSMKIVIVQPRRQHIDGPVREYTVTMDELNAFADELKAKADEVYGPNPLVKAGSHCKFCPAMPICPAFSKEASEIATRDFKDLSKENAFPLPEALTQEQLIHVLDMADIFNTWLKSVEGHVLSLLESGEKLPGYKLVKKRANRRWAGDTKEVAGQLAMYMSDDQIFDRKLRSPAQIEKIIGKKQKGLLDDLIVVPDAGNTIATSTDPRAEVSNARVDFQPIP